MDARTEQARTMRRRSALAAAVALWALLGPGVLQARLVKAARTGDATAARLLLGLGVDPNVGSGETTVLVAAARAGNEGVVQLLLARGAYADQVTEYGERPIDAAVEAGHLGVVRLLLASGARVTPGNLDAAGRACRLDIAAALLGSVDPRGSGLDADAKRRRLDLLEAHCGSAHVPLPTDETAGPPLWAGP